MGGEALGIRCSTLNMPAWIRSSIAAWNAGARIGAVDSQSMGDSSSWDTRLLTWASRIPICILMYAAASSINLSLAACLSNRVLTIGSNWRRWSFT